VSAVAVNAPAVSSASTGPVVDRIIPDAVLPKAADVVIIGGGIIGVSAALALAERGVSVVLCEKGVVAGEQSSRNSGWVRQAGRDSREMPLIVEALRQWRGMNARTGTETGFRECGVLYVGASVADEQRFQAWIESVAAFDIGARLVRGEELAGLMAGAATQFPCGMYVAGDGCAEPQKAAPAIARAAQAHGAVVVEQCAVRGIERSAGRVSGIVTERGTIKCSTAILAGGAWSSLLCAGLDIVLPQLKVLIPIFRTSPVPDGPVPCTWLKDLGYRRRLDGGYTINAASGFGLPLVPDSLRFMADFLPLLRREWKTFRPLVNEQARGEWRPRRSPRSDAPTIFEATRILDPATNRAHNACTMRAMVALNPRFKHVSVVQEWAGYIDVTPDLTPCIDAVDAVPGLILATGFSGHGFGIGPGAGRLCAEIALGASPCVDPRPFRLSRFHDGSPLVLGAEI
jgi:glycine/D-amino acid oxidase-like deaminating enzyme